jgi:DNA-binding NarL/FixJ family response regulator
MDNMENHLDIYIYLKYGRHYDTLFSEEELIKKVNAYYSHHFYSKEELLDIYTGLGKPKTYQVVKRLAEMGFAPKTISQWVEISPSTISIHLSKSGDKIKEYKNYRLIEYYNAKMYLLRTYGEEY